jgi:hypothetical protein
MANLNTLNQNISQNKSNQSNQTTNAIIATLASFGAAIALASPAFADTRVASLSLDLQNQANTVTCLNDGEFYRGMVSACETLSDVEATKPTKISFAVNSDRLAPDVSVQADSMITIDPQGKVACFLPANGSEDGTVACGLVSVD